MDDTEQVSVQIGRPARGQVTIVARCHLGLPVVARVPAVLPDGSPFPTLYWLTCPVLKKAVDRLEAAGGVRAYDRRRRQESPFAAECAAADVAYAAARGSGHGGVGGSSGGTKCLHAHLAHYLAGGDNPIGREVAASVDNRSCSRPCV